MRILSFAAALSVFGTSAGAQSLPDQVARVRDGIVTFNYAARPGVCGDGETYVRLGDSYVGQFNTRTRAACEAGPVQVAVTMAGGEAQRVQWWVGPLRRREGTDLGRVSSIDAAKYLASLAERGSSGASTKAILPAVMADSATVWPSLLSIARDTRTRSRTTRNEASMWLSRYAASAIMGRPNDPLSDDEMSDTDDGLKTQAVFVLSQLPRNEGIPELLEVARTNRNPRVRSSALFWLGQSGDPRAIDLFASLLH